MNERLTNTPLQTVAIIGGGPAGLMAAETLIKAGVKVEVYDTMPSVGRKFLMAGKGGMNITHSEAFEQFLSRYGDRAVYLEPILHHFKPDRLRIWLQELGFSTFVGSSGRVFPSDMKSAPLLRAWLHRLREQGVCFHVRHRWLGWGSEDGEQKTEDRICLYFATPQGEVQKKVDAVVLALGGGSWAKLGSTGSWVSLLNRPGIEIKPLKPSNCGFDVGWSTHFCQRFAGVPLKSIRASFRTLNLSGDLIITATGVEGGVCYTMSAALRDQIDAAGFAVLHLDLAPDKTLSTLIQQLSKARGKQSMSNHLRKTVGIEGVKAGLLREVLPINAWHNPVTLATVIKSLPIKLSATRPIDEAISTAGGVCFESLTQQLMIRTMPGVFCAGEMLDFDAPTGGYLLTASFASGRVAGLGVLSWLRSEDRRQRTEDKQEAASPLYASEFKH